MRRGIHDYTPIENQRTSMMKVNSYDTILRKILGKHMCFMEQTKIIWIYYFYSTHSSPKFSAMKLYISVDSCKYDEVDFPAPCPADFSILINNGFF